MEREEFKILVKAMKAVYAQPTFIPDKDAFDVWYGLLQDVCPTLTSQSMGICRIERIVRGGAGRYAAQRQSHGKEYRNGKGSADFQRGKSMRICLF